MEIKITGTSDEIKELFQAIGSSEEQNEKAPISINGKKYAKHPEAKV